MPGFYKKFRDSQSLVPSRGALPCTGDAAEACRGVGETWPIGVLSVSGADPAENHPVDSSKRAVQIAWAKSYCFSGRDRMRRPVAANTALHRAGASGITGGSPTPPQKPPLGTSTVSTFGISARCSIL